MKFVLDFAEAGSMDERDRARQDSMSPVSTLGTGGCSALESANLWLNRIEPYCNARAKKCD